MIVTGRPSVEERLTNTEGFSRRSTSRTSLGETVWGITAEALELAGLDNPELTYQPLPGLVGAVMKTFDPVHTWTKVGGVVMPVIYDPRKLLVADVI